MLHVLVLLAMCLLICLHIASKSGETWRVIQFKYRTIKYDVICAEYDVIETEESEVEEGKQCEDKSVDTQLVVLRHVAW